MRSADVAEGDRSEKWLVIKDQRLPDGDTYWIPDHAGCDLHHGAVNDIATDGQPPPFAMWDEAKGPLSAGADKIAPHTEKHCGV